MSSPQSNNFCFTVVHHAAVRTDAQYAVYFAARLANHHSLDIHYLATSDRDQVTKHYSRHHMSPIGQVNSKQLITDFAYRKMVSYKACAESTYRPGYDWFI